MPRTALFVIDIQQALALSTTTSIPHASRILNAGPSILAKVRAAIDTTRSQGLNPDLEIVIVQHEETPDKGALQRGSKEWELVFPPRANDEYERLASKNVRTSPLSLMTSLFTPSDCSAGDAFTSNPDLAADLRSRGVDTIVAFGIQSECCVLSTCRGALAAGFRVVLLRGAHSTYDAGGKSAGEIERDVEAMLGADGAEVLEWEEWEP